ncbi:BlaI/MecI/CopY family transcriptional regulator [Mycobacterium sp. PS03-16]|uniref:BlaI/MecI/CopY family transcriptional regulator n=1 Tax=Mycobacterium sp. PS03-16 TaxID=2559611 RepID=UPI0010741080|nr:BlaI/MecI/CopY family transcriptional regulator [Mycobacterium sp. PS03-16]TFV55211.1 BlaI/MecI/CopY family transcriptional regulator [Mycobacterium sp. PS03-16]
MQQRGFGDLEAVVMDLAWEHDAPVLVRELYDEISMHRPIAYTTVMSTMDNLHRKGWLTRDKTGKAYRYWPTMTRAERSAKLMRDALASGGDADLVLTSFLEQMTPEEAGQLRTVLTRLARRRKTP